MVGSIAGFVIIAAVSFFTAGEAPADVIPACDLQKGARLVEWPDGLPPKVFEDFTRHVERLAAPEEQFDATDVIMTNKRRRLIRVVNLGSLWVIAYEHGGRAYHDHIVVYEISGAGNPVRLIANDIAFPKSVCAQTNAWLSGSRMSDGRPIGDWDW